MSEAPEAQRRRPPMFWVIASVLILIGFAGISSLLWSLLGSKPTIAEPSSLSPMASNFLGLISAVIFPCYLVSGILMLFLNRRASPILIAGLIFNFVYAIANVIVFPLLAQWQHPPVGRPSGSFLAFFVMGFAFVIARRIVGYVRAQLR